MLSASTENVEIPGAAAILPHRVAAKKDQDPRTLHAGSKCCTIVHFNYQHCLIQQAHHVLVLFCVARAELPRSQHPHILFVLRLDPA